MKVSDFDYICRRPLIAQRPIEPRDASRLLVSDRRDGAIPHRVFRDLPIFFSRGTVGRQRQPGHCRPALFGVKEGTGGSVELLLLERESLDTWEVLARPARRLRPGARISFGEGLLRGRSGRDDTIGRTGGHLSLGRRLRRTSCDGLGQMPLPPYIKERLDDPERYQTVYARQEGSKAAPTAGLHFTQELLET